jgi:protein Mpv17
MLGAFLHAPFIHLWFKSADRLFGPGFSWAKLIADQSLAFPTFLAAFLSANEASKLISSSNFNLSQISDSIVSKLSADFVETYQTGLMIWPFAQFLNFKLVAPPFRLLFMNATSLVWGIYLSSQGQKLAVKQSTS